MSIGRWIDKEAVVHIHNGLLLSYKKECIWVSYNEVDEPGAYCTEWSKSEGVRQILYINVYIWNLERWYQWFYMQSNKRDTDVKNRLLDSVGEGKGGMIWENSIETCILPYVKQSTSASLVHEAGHQSWCSGITQRDRVWRGVRRGFQDRETHVYLWLIYYWCMAKTIKIL